MKKIIYLSLATITLFFTSCKKDDMSKYATKEDLLEIKSDNTAKSHNFFLNFSTSINYGQVPYFATDPTDIVLYFVHYDDLGNSATWVQLPATIGGFNIIPEISESSTFINVFNPDGTGNPFTGNETLEFKAIVLSFSQIQANPNVDLTNYEAVKEAFKL